MKLWGRKKEQFYDHPLKDIIHAPSSEDARDYYQRVMNSRRLNVYLGKKLNNIFEGKKQ